MEYSWKIKEIIKKDIGNKENVIYKVFWEKLERMKMGTLDRLMGQAFSILMKSVMMDL